MKKRCRHSAAWPTIYFNRVGFMWCSDCGARRDIRMMDGGTGFHHHGPWIYPRGHEDVLEQLARSEKRVRP